MKIAIGSDHGGFKLKETIKKHLKDDIKDFGTFDENSVDYPDIARSVAESVSDGTFDRGILICRTGIGMCMVANKFPSVRAALCNDELSAELTRKHNDSNILTLSGETDKDLALRIVDKWINTEFEGGRHERRVNKIKEIEDNNFRK